MSAGYPVHLRSALAYDRRLGLGQQRKDGNTGVTTNDGDLVLGGLGRLSDDGGNEGGSSDNVEVGDTEQPGISCFRESVRLSLLLGVKDTGLLEGLGEDWDGRVDGVGDD
jgi:hypothetical protein